MKHSRNSKAYREAWLAIAIVILLAYVHDLTYHEILMKKQEKLVNSYLYGE